MFGLFPPFRGYFLLPALTGSTEQRQEGCQWTIRTLVREWTPSLR
jgi:hypothetical protein